MPIPLLNPHLDLTFIANMGDVAADWLMDEGVEPSDVLLMFGQGFEVVRLSPIRSPHGETWAGVEKENKVHWYLPRSCLARYAGNVYGEDRKIAVEEWRVVQLGGWNSLTSMLDRGSEWAVEKAPSVRKPGLGERHSVHDSKAAAGREWRRCILRLFPEVSRRTQCFRCERKKWLDQPPPENGTVRCIACLDSHEWTAQAWHFMPEPEPEPEELTIGGQLFGEVTTTIQEK